MKQITKLQYYQLLGLQKLALDMDKKLKDLQDSVVSIVEEKDREGFTITCAGDGWSGEFIYSPESKSVDEFLRMLEVEVIDE